jgi:hypothetical protein
MERRKEEKGKKKRKEKEDQISAISSSLVTSFSQYLPSTFSFSVYIDNCSCCSTKVIIRFSIFRQASACQLEKYNFVLRWYFFI